MQTELEKEQEQLRKLEAYRKIFLLLWLKYWPLSLAIFLIVVVMSLGFVALKGICASDRFEAKTKLFFYPRESTMFRVVDSRQVLELFRRQSVLAQTGEKLGMPDGLKHPIVISTEKNKPNLIILTANAESKDFATRIVNTFASFCISEYRNYRTQELAGQMVLLLKRKKELEVSIADAEAKQQSLVKSPGSLNLEQEFGRLRKEVSEELATLSEINIQYSNEEARQKKLTEQLKGSTGIQHAAQLKLMLDDQERLQKEQVRLQQLYTEKNPRLRAVVSELATARETYQEFLKTNDIGDFTPNQLTQWETMQKALNSAQEKMDYLYENREALKKEIDVHQKAIAKLMAVMPEYNEAAILRASQVSLLHGTEEAIGELQLLIAAINSDASQAEEATSAVTQPLFSKKSVAICLVLALWVTGMVGIVLVWFEFVFGKVKNAKELSCFSELELLGEYPDQMNAEVRDAVAQRICHGFLAASTGKRILFSGALEGGHAVPEIDEALEWAFKMNGTRFFRIRIAVSEEFSTEETLLAAVQKFGDTGIMPVQNPHALSPAEQELLKSDVYKLLETYDIVGIQRDEAVTSSDLLFRQMMEMCEYSLLYFGAEATPRKLMRLAIKLRKETDCSVLAIVAGGKDATKEAR